MGESNSNVDATKFIFITACCERFQSSRGVKNMPARYVCPVELNGVAKEGGGSLGATAGLDTHCLKTAVSSYAVAVFIVRPLSRPRIV